MFLNSLTFEWRYYLRQPSFYVTMLAFFLLPFLATTTDNVRIGGGGNVMIGASAAHVTDRLLLHKLRSSWGFLRYSSW